MQLGVQRDLVGAVGLPCRGGRRRNEIADAADVDHEAFGRVRDRAAAQPGDQPAILSSGGASAWQIATANASAACVGVGSSCMPRIAFTIFCTCCFSARP